MAPDGEWVFGYGSLVWRPDFPFAERQNARIEGWRRVFWQGSTDHRGVPGAPGRVVTLVPEREAVCWGTAYRITPQEFEAVIAHLDYREKGGYALEAVSIHMDGVSVDGMVYVATPDNPNFLGHAPSSEIADQVLRSYGPSGPNDEYVLRLADALRDMGADDSHVYEIDRLIRSARPKA